MKVKSFRKSRVYIERTGKVGCDCGCGEGGAGAAPTDIHFKVSRSCSYCSLRAHTCRPPTTAPLTSHCRQQAATTRAIAIRQCHLHYIMIRNQSP